MRRNVPAIGPPIPRTTTKKDTDTPIGSTEPTSFAGIRCHFFNGRPRSCHQGERCAFSHKSVISVTRRRKEQRFRAAQAAQRKPDGPAGLPDLESPTRHSDASKPNAQRTTGGFSNLTWKNSCSSASGTEHAAGATKKRARSTSPEKQISPSALKADRQSAPRQPPARRCPPIPAASKAPCWPQGRPLTKRGLVLRARRSRSARRPLKAGRQSAPRQPPARRCPPTPTALKAPCRPQGRPFHARFKI